ncbi:hypothetical protein FBEOM_6914 [Fusarium beomiforme]|uniref:Uncharacterized protein n=1 Tax=Fusarium beomiforme TaxID=44412 RepID=A0A9P5AIN0_9HYPO|nr:hypothetical protein FBEOM_6914 [Fusarium beomiforme]
MATQNLNGVIRERVEQVMTPITASITDCIDTIRRYQIRRYQKLVENTLQCLELLQLAHKNLSELKIILDELTKSCNSQVSALEESTAIYILPSFPKGGQKT